jgi:fibronectin-binding autotransporter adhesin
VNGILDISGAQSSVSVQSLSGAGQILLGAQNLNHAGGQSTFSGSLSDGGLYAGTGGGSLTVTGGSLTLTGNNTHSGGTTVAGGTLTLSGALGGFLAVLPGGTFLHTAGATFTGELANLGKAAVNGVMNANVANFGTLSGIGTVIGNVLNAGTIAPGNSIGTSNITGS